MADTNKNGHYDRAFYDTVNSAGATSAGAVLPHVLKIVPATSVIDVGCGTGIWACEARRLGVEDVVGVDGAYVPADQRRLVGSSFVERDLTKPLSIGRTADLALCLEVAEHLPQRSSDHLIGELVNLAPAVLFSAATPLQGGTDHINEQWPSYWIERFETHGYTCWDAVRPKVRYDADVAWIYRQNLMLVLGPGHPALSSMQSSSRLMVPVEGDVEFEYVARYLLEREDGLKRTVKRLPGLIFERVRRPFF